MPSSHTSEVIQHLRRTLVREGADLTDGQLLECFLSRREPAALEALVRRHGPMVWGVCRRTLRNHHDAEDAFQATFLVLVRKAASIRANVGNWLYGVAHQTALKAKATRAKRRLRERSVLEMPEPTVTDQDLWSDLQPLLDQEVSRLPEKYRTVIVLCELEGRTVREAARQLGCPEGTVASRLARARTMLAKRLARHGLAVSGATLAAVLSQKVASACVPASVWSSTIKAVTLVAAVRAVATGLISVQVAALTEGVVKAMFVTKLKSVLAAVLVVAVVCGGAGVGMGLIHGSGAVAQPTPTLEEAKKPGGQQAEKPKPSVVTKAESKDARAVDVLNNLLFQLAPAERLRVLGKVVDKDRDFVSATRGALGETLVERGSLHAVELTNLVCRVRTEPMLPPVIIKWIIDDGRRVKKGDKLIEFDSSGHADLLRKQKEVVAKAESERKRAADALERIQNENRIDVKLAEIDLRLAELALRHYKGNDALQKETLAIQVERAALVVERVKLQGPPKLDKATDLLNAKKSACQREQDRQRGIEENIANCVLTAPRDGVVFYSIPEQARFGGGQQAIVAVGQPVQEGQKLLWISDLKRMAVLTPVPESLIHKVRTGQTVTVRVDAYPGRTYAGRVSEVATRASHAEWLGSGTKVYMAMISIDGENKDLKPGMSAEPTILIGEQPHCLRVPASAALGKGKETFCYVFAGNELQVRKVTIGLSDGKLAEIQDGLKEGDLVLRDPSVAIKRLTHSLQFGKQ